MPVSQKTFRVFISSTFSDMRAERKILQESVFPRLKSLCEEHGATFQDVDLRWGVSEDTQLDQKTMDICLGEIARCQKLSPKPNFIVLLGDRYGWQPIPNKIPSSEMGEILAATTDTDHQLLTRWYLEDANAIPAEYVLQPRGEEHKDFNVWQSIESQLRNTLRTAVSRLNFTEGQRVKYFASATHQEIIRGALNPPSGVLDPQEHVFAYVRSISNLPETREAADYIDLDNDQRDPYNKEQLGKLRIELKAKLPQNHVYEYGSQWKQGCVLDNPKIFGERVYDDLKAVIETELSSQVSPEALTEEVNRHECLKNRLIQYFTGRKDDLVAISTYLKSDSNKVLSVIGASGSGKTSLMAKAINDNSDDSTIKIFRFIGATSNTSQEQKLLLQLIEQITKEYGIEQNTLLKEGDDEKKFTTMQGISELFQRSLCLSTEDKPLIVFLDALDQLKTEHTDPLLNWIPNDLPEHTKVVVSALPDFKNKLENTDIHELHPMPEKEGSLLLDLWLGAINRTIQPVQNKSILDRFKQNGNPLYLKLTFEKAKEWHSYTGMAELKADIEGILEEYFTSLETKHGSLLLSKFCGYLLSGKYQGLTENEFINLFSFDDEYWQHFIEASHPAHREEIQKIKKLPIVVWSRLFLDIEPYLTEKDANGVSILSFYHRKFLEYTKKRYLNEASGFHNRLADFFEAEPLYLDDKEKVPNRRKVIEQPYQQTLARRWNDLEKKSLANFDFLMAKIKADYLDQIQEDYQFLYTVDASEIKDKLNIWSTFFNAKMHILRRGNDQWPSHKILLQLAMEHADDSPITLAAEEFMQLEKCDWQWIKRKNRPKQYKRDLCLLVMEGHKGEVIGAQMLSDGRSLSWSADNTLRLWDGQSGAPLAVLQEQNESIKGAQLLTDGRILTWSKNCTLRLWDWHISKPLVVMRGVFYEFSKPIQVFTDGRVLSCLFKELYLWDGKSGVQLAVMKGHTESIEGAQVLPDGRILSWSDDNTLRLWDGQSGAQLAVMKGHTESIKGTQVLPDGRVLSWSADNTLRLWDGQSGAQLAVMENHSYSIYGAQMLSDGRLLSWSFDSLRLWDVNSGTPLVEEMRGHVKTIKGVQVLSDGRLLSWSEDNTLRLWDGQSGAPLALMKGHTRIVNGAHILTDGRVLSWSNDGTLRLWDGQGGMPQTVLRGHTGSIIGTQVLDDGRVLSWSDDGTLRLWDVQSVLPQEEVEEHTDKIRGAQVLPDGRAVSWSIDATVRLWDGQSGAPLAVMKGHGGTIWGAQVLSDGRLLSWSIDGTLRLWDGQDGAPLAVMMEYPPDHCTSLSLISTLTGYVEPINAKVLPDGRILSWSSNGTVHIWDGQSGAQLTVIEHDKLDLHGGVQVLSDGRLLSLASDNTLRLWDGQSGRPLALMKGHTSRVNGVQPLADSRILSWSDDKTLRLWDGQRVIGQWSLFFYEQTQHFAYGLLYTPLEFIGRLLSRFVDKKLRLSDMQLVVMKGHRYKVKGARVLSDGRILSWSDDNTLRLWDGQSGAQLAVMKGHTESIKGTQVLPDGRVLSWSADNTLRLWDGQSGALLETFLQPWIETVPYPAPWETVEEFAEARRFCDIWIQPMKDYCVIANRLAGWSAQWHGEDARFFGYTGATYVFGSGRQLLFLEIMGV